MYFYIIYIISGLYFQNVEITASWLSKFSFSADSKVEIQTTPLNEQTSGDYIKKSWVFFRFDIYTVAGASISIVILEIYKKILLNIC